MWRRKTRWCLQSSFFRPPFASSSYPLFGQTFWDWLCEQVQQLWRPIGKLWYQGCVFLVAQREPLRVKLGRGQYSNENYIVLRNLSGHRPGARAWFDHLNEYVQKEADFQHCPLNLCLARNDVARTCGWCDVDGWQDLCAGDRASFAPEEVLLELWVVEVRGWFSFLFEEVVYTCRWLQCCKA